MEQPKRCKKCGKNRYPNNWDGYWSLYAPPMIYLNGTTNFCECEKPQFESSKAEQAAADAAVLS